MNKKIRKRCMFGMLQISVIFALTSCVMDRVVLFGIKNCTSDTLLIELSESDTLDNCFYWGKNPEDTIRHIMQEDTTWIYPHGEKVIIDDYYYVLPDSTQFFTPYIFYINDSIYIYAIKWNIAKSYTLDEIRAKKLYDKQPVRKKDFHNRLFEYRYVKSN
jgi:hypothetical protein